MPAPCDRTGTGNLTRSPCSLNLGPCQGKPPSALSKVPSVAGPRLLDRRAGMPASARGRHPQPTMAGSPRSHRLDSQSIGRKGDDVKGDRRSDAASCPAILHDAGNRGSRHSRARQDGGGRDRYPIASAAPDLWIIFANDHVEQFFHTAAPPFTVHVGGEAKGEFAGRRFHWRVPGEIGFEIVRQMY